MRPPAVCPLIAAHHHAGTAEAPCRLQGLRMPGRCEAHHSQRTATQANSQPHVQVYAGTGKAVPTRVDVAAHRPLPGPSNPSLEAAGGRRESSSPVLGEHRRASRDCDFRIFLISYLPLVHPAMSNLSADGADCEKPSRRTLGSSELPEPPTNLKKVLQAP